MSEGLLNEYKVSLEERFMQHISVKSKRLCRSRNIYFAQQSLLLLNKI
jgi:hypothetical protein